MNTNFLIALTVVIVNNFVMSPQMFDFVSKYLPVTEDGSPTLVGIALHSLVTLVVVTLVGLLLLRFVDKASKTVDKLASPLKR